MTQRTTRHILASVFTVLVTVTSVNGQLFHNLDFQQLCDSSKTGLCYWSQSWGASGAVSPSVVNNKKCLLILGKKETSVGFVEQPASYASSGMSKIITVTASIRSDSVVGKGAGLNLGLYDKEGTLIVSKDMGGLYSIEWIRGTTGWKEYSISAVCPPETETIKVGMILFGRGKVLFRDYRVTLVPLAERKPSRLAEKYIAAACDSIRTYSLVRDSINIKAMKETALKVAGPAKKYSDCYLAITYLLESLRPYGDHHSFLMTANELANWKNEGSQVSKIEYPTHKIIDSCGYLNVPPFHGGNPTQMLAYADSLQSAIQKLQSLAIKGWLIDLRQNTGGNMSPMIAGLGPLFSSEKLGSLVDVNGKSNSWNYANGKYFWDDDAGWSVSHPQKLTSKLPVAVLTSGQTGSSGEAVVVSFIGNDKTKSFGQPTWGLTTGNGSFDLPDGSQIFLMSTIMADRNGRQYQAGITPDLVIDNKAGNENDPVIQAAVDWIVSQQ